MASQATQLPYSGIYDNTGANLITKANMGGEKQQALLNPKVK